LVIQLALGNGLFLYKRRIALNIQLRLPKLGLSLGKLRLRLIEHRLEWTRIDVEQYLVLADNRAFPVVLLDQISRDLRLDDGVHITVEGCNIFVVNGHILLRDISDLHARGWRR